MADQERLSKATGLWRKAYALQMEGKFDEAVTLYKASIDVLPTAEAHTFLGWTYSFMDHLRDAIAECQKAIALDPEFGNPWNDIGAYLIRMGEPEKAIPYLERALNARRYDTYQFVHVNLGRAHVLLGRFEDAKRAFMRALEVDPSSEHARDALIRLIARFN